MKFSMKQFRAALAVFKMLRGRRMVFPFKGFSSRPNPASPSLPSLTGPWLADWRRFQWVPLFESVHPTAERLIIAVQRHEMLALRYWGGSTPGVARFVSPALVFQAGGCGPLYFHGYCHLRRAERVFRVERVELLWPAATIICITE